MATTISGMTFRLTNEDDLPAIKSISADLNPEFDYIVECYSSLSKDPLFFGAIAEINGDPVAFGVGTIQLEGKKIYSRSDRVKHGFRNKGILGCLKKFLRETLRDTLYPELKYEELTTHDTNPAIHKLIDNPLYVEVYRSTFLVYALDKAQQCSNGDVEEIGTNGIREIMDNENLCAKFFPVRIFVGYVDFEPVPSELELITKHKPFVLASYSKHDGQMDQLTIGVRVSSSAYVIHWIVPFNTDSGSVASNFKAHLSIQFRKMEELNDGGYCVIIFPDCYRQIIESTTLDFGCSFVQAQGSEFIGFRREF